MSRIVVSDLTERDLIRLGVRPGCAFWGRVGRRNGVIVGFGAAFWSDDEEPVLCFDARSSGARPLWLAREARRLLRDAPFDRAVAYCNHEIAPAERFLAWLGFTPTGQIIDNARVWEWKR